MGQVGGFSSGSSVTVQKVGAGSEVTLNIVITVKLEDDRQPYFTIEPQEKSKEPPRKIAESDLLIPEIEIFDRIKLE